MPQDVRLFRVVFAFIAVLMLSGCFTATRLFKEQRVWDLAWQGRYRDARADYVVLGADRDARIYLVGEIEREKHEFRAYRAALYPGWEGNFILGTQPMSPQSEVNFQVIRAVGQSGVEMASVQCESKKEPAKKIERDPCTFSSIDVLRSAIKAKYLADAANAKKGGGDNRVVLDRLKANPLSALAATTVTATFEDAEGVRGALRVTQSAAPSLRVGDLIVAVNGQDAASAAELSLRIAFERAGAKVRLTLLDPAAKKTRDVTIATIAQPAP